MRKAFDTNVPKLRPRLKTAVLTEEGVSHAEPDDVPHADMTFEQAAALLEGSGVEAAAEAPAAPPEVVAREPEVAVLPPPAPPPAPVAVVAAVATIPAPALSVPPPAVKEVAPVVPMAAPIAPAAAPVAAQAPSHHNGVTAAQTPLAFDESPDVQSRRERLLKI